MEIDDESIYMEFDDEGIYMEFDDEGIYMEFDEDIYMDAIYLLVYTWNLLRIDIHGI